MGGRIMVAVCYVSGTNMAQVEAVEVFPCIVCKGLEHGAEFSTVRQPYGLAVLCSGDAQLHGNRHAR